MDIKRLEVFCKVVEQESFTRAADAVGLSQPTVSENIRILEEALDEKLLDRLGRKVLPTGAGKILYRHARRIIKMRDEAFQAIEEYKGNLSGHLSLGASTIPGAYILPKVIEAFKARHAAIQVTVKIAGTARIVEDLLQGNLELGIVGARPKDATLECEEIFSDELVLTVYPDHPWAGRQAVSPEELEDHPFIVRESGSGTRTVMNQTLKGVGFDPDRLSLVAEMGSTEAVRQGIKARIGASIISFLAVAEDIHQGTLVTVPVEGLQMSRTFHLIQRRNRRLYPLGLAFRHHLQGGAF
ncbi:MAG: LysR family transcriptional regulator [Desulfuromonas sp.]|uniref:selenium metabolism-associated LysR family transcriptional regulator n=1 Tax=Desulfuromonas sp. TaxID=892 RepID=UPI000CAFFC4C|nr:selenium metabolism-associated LysR family transcriptional regulator [Desulfuromonas sp.]PLX86055.1 MAG: LysR family transcriptional regulator [Desulfuromonas sp.]